MKKLVVILAVTLFSLSGLAGCSGGARTYTDIDSTINTTVNQEFIIKLDSNPTTGYSWQASFDDTMLKLVKQEYQVNTNPATPVVGVGGTESIKMQALKKGETKLTLTYRRSWEAPSAEDTVEEFTITIK